MKPIEIQLIPIHSSFEKVFDERGRITGIVDTRLISKAEFKRMFPQTKHLPVPLYSDLTNI